MLAAEIFLMLAFFLIVVVDILLYRKKSEDTSTADSQNWLWGFCLAIVVFCSYIVINQPESNFSELQHNYFYLLDAPAYLFKIIILLASIILLFHIKIWKYKLANEFYPLLIFQLIGLFLLTMASNFLLIYISIEIVSIASYIFAAMGVSKKSAEASVKYALFGGVASAIMLYGISLMYGLSGTLDILSPDFSRNLNQTDANALNIIILFTLSGFLFKISAFPFHLWVPDVYEATPTPIVSYLSIAPKAAGILVLTRLLMVLPSSQQNIIIIISIVSIAIGNFTALRQTNIKRLLAYSTIAQAGFIIGAISCLSNLGLQSAYFYLIGYIFTNMLAFLIIDIVEKNENSYLIENYKGLASLAPTWGILLVICMISLVGLPPTVGFSGKLFIFSALWEAYQNAHNPYILALFIFGLLNTAIALYFYLKIPFYAFFRKSTNVQAIQFEMRKVLFSAIIAIPILFYFFKADLLMNWLAEILR
jgi:NADH-quinone oxidoreductase subunit N